MSVNAANAGDLRLPGPRRSGALLRHERAERGPALLDVLAATVRTAYLPFSVVNERQDRGEELFAMVTDELVVGHTGTAQKKKAV